MKFYLIDQAKKEFPVHRPKFRVHFKLRSATDPASRMMALSTRQQMRKGAQLSRNVRASWTNCCEHAICEFIRRSPNWGSRLRVGA